MSENRLSHRHRVLFLCTGNSCRSQMAEGWLRPLAGNRFESLSAGANPAESNAGTSPSMILDAVFGHEVVVAGLLTEPPSPTVGLTE